MLNNTHLIITGYRAFWSVPGKGSIAIRYDKEGSSYTKTFEDLSAPDYSQMVDMLRNEKPVYFNESRGNVIMTGKVDEWEPVGEEESSNYGTDTDD